MVTMTPPSTFNPLTASSQALAEYGFPSKPTDVASQAAWSTAMQAYRSDPAPSGPLPVTVASTAPRNATKYGTWGGWVAGNFTGTSTTYVAVKGDQTVPKPSNTCTAGNQVAFWVGLGGTSSPVAPLVQQGFSCGQAPLGGGSAFRPWTEFAPNQLQVNFCGYTSWTLPQGDVIYENMSFQTSSHTAYFFLEDITTGVTHSCSSTKPSGWTFQGNTAEWVAEANDEESVKFGSVNFTNSNAQLNSSGSWVTLGSQTTTKLVLGASSSTYCISPGAIGADGQSFTDSYHQEFCNS